MSKETQTAAPWDIASLKDFDDKSRAYLLNNGLMVVNGVFASGSAALMTRELLLVNKTGKVRIYLCSSGGIVAEALGLHDAIAGLTAQGIDTEVVGLGLWLVQQWWCCRRLRGGWRCPIHSLCCMRWAGRVVTMNLRRILL